MHCKNTGSITITKESYERLYAAGMLKQKDNNYVQLYGEAKTKYSVVKDKISDIKKLEKNVNTSLSI